MFSEEENEYRPSIKKKNKNKCEIYSTSLCPREVEGCPCPKFVTGSRVKDFGQLS